MNEYEMIPGRLDKAFAAFLTERSGLSGIEKSRFKELVTELSYELNHGHSCIRIDSEAQVLLKTCKLVSEQHRTPLILEENRLYLHRYWHYETQLAKQIRGMTGECDLSGDLEEVLDRYFPVENEDCDWQKEAARKAATHFLSIISGGPGTGKTTTVVKILAVLLEVMDQSPNIALAAPTGKAAMRLQESIGRSKDFLPCEETIKDCIPEAVMTIHRLLGAKPKSPSFSHHAGNPLPFDLVVVDEASMIDLALMSKLVDAFKPETRLILLGDKDQLASVESGAVLVDLTDALPGYTQELKKSYRFEKNIKALADAVNQQQSDVAWNIIQGEKRKFVNLEAVDLMGYIVEKQFDYLALIDAGAEFREIYQSFNQFQALCATRHGKNSVAEINRKVEQQLILRDKIKSFGQWYIGRPVMITQNDAGMHLFNGDIGICMANSVQSDKLMVFFERPDGSIKKFPPSRLPHCETVFAMTIHKSQGSEFNEVLLTLPEKINPVLTKELIYTAITRAREKVTLVVNRDVFYSAVNKKVNRYGGLKDKLQF